VIDLITRSPERIEAPCQHFNNCGGCTWQDLEYQKQLEYKKKQVNDCLTHLAALDNIKIFDTLASPEVFHYRNKMEYSFHVSKDGGFTLGLHRRGIFDLEECHLQSEISSRIVRWMRQFVKDENLPVYDVFRHHGYMRFLMIRLTKNTDQLMVNIVTNYGDWPCPEKLVDGMLDAFPNITTIVHNQNGQKSNIATGEIEQVLFGPGYIEEKLMDHAFRIRANSFFQTNSLQAENLYRTAFEMLDPQPSDRLLDLYSGTGTIGILISNHIARVTSVELVADAVKVARENADLNNVKNIVFHEENVVDFLKKYDSVGTEFDTIVVDPPRAGLNPKALKRIIALKPEKILYISCNPATFARDAKELVKNGFSLPIIKPVDMFPHTQHIELTAVFYNE